MCIVQFPTTGRRKSVGPVPKVQVAPEPAASVPVAPTEAIPVSEPGVVSISAMSTHEVLSRTLWAEARSHGAEGMKAVASVIVNRSKNPGWWGRNIKGVCLAPWQFSCWNDSDPQAKMMRAEKIVSSPSFEIAKDIALAAITDKLEDTVAGADHYYAEYIPTPKWAVGRSPVAVFGKPKSRHFFFKIGLRG